MSVVVEKAAKSGRKAKGDGYLRRAEILQAAEALFVREGYHGATIRKIAQDVGLSSTALYMHFQDKSEILVEICGKTFSHLRTTNEEIAALPLPPLDRVRRMLEAYIQFGLAHPNAYLIVFERSADVSPEKQAVLNTLGHQMSEPFMAVLQDLASETPLRCSVGEAGHICWVACHGLISMTVNHAKLDWPAPPERMTTLMLDTLLNGLMAE